MAHVGLDTTLRHVGEHFIVGLTSHKLTEEDKRLLATLQPAGVLLLTRNFHHGVSYEEWLTDLDRLLADVYQYAARDKLLISIDHEGGRVHCTPLPVTGFPPAAVYAPRAEKVGAAMGAELRSLGVSVTWAPVADVHSNAENPIIGDRAFGTDPAAVGAAAIAFDRGIRSQGVLTCAKHYPGHGDTSCDSHLELPYLELGLEDLERRELLPFKALADAGVPAMMTAHVLFRGVDAENPATLSKKLLRSIVRDRWGYKGVMIADDIGMLAVRSRFVRPDTAAEAMEAGCDMYIVSRHPDPIAEDIALPVAANLSRSIERGAVRERTLADAKDRVRTFIDAAAPRSAPYRLKEKDLEAHAALAGECRRDRVSR